VDVKEKIAQNVWDHVDQVLPVIQAMKDRKWHWFLNTKCKYINLRIDMRDGGCLIMVDSGDQKRRINPEDLAYQYPEGQKLLNGGVSESIEPVQPNSLPPSF